MSSGVFSRQQFAGMLLFNFHNYSEEWKREIAVFLYIAKTNGDASKAVTRAEQLMEQLQAMPVPFMVDEIFDLESESPKARVIIEVNRERITLLGSLEEDMPIMCLCGGMARRSTARAAIELVLAARHIARAW